MGLSLFDPPAVEPLELDEVKAHCRVTGNEDDNLFSSLYIPAARSFAEGYTHRAFITQTWDYTLENWPLVGCEVKIELPMPPLQTVTHVKYVDTDGTLQTLAADQYTVRTDGPVGCIYPSYGATWPSVRCQPAAVQVRFVAGYEDAAENVPADLRAAMLLLIGQWYENRETVGLSNFTQMDFATEALLSGYRSLRF